MSLRSLGLFACLLGGLSACSTELDRQSQYDQKSDPSVQASAEITGTVWLEGEADHAGISILIDGPVKASVASASDGSFAVNQLIPGRYSLSFAERGFEPVNLAPFEVSLADKLSLGQITLKLRRARVTGSVSDPDNPDSPLQGGIVYVKRTAGPRSALGSGPAFTYAAAASGSDGSAALEEQALVDGDGSYSLGELAAGTYELTLQYPKSAPVYSEFTVSGEQSEQALQTLEVAPLTGFFQIQGKLADGSTSSSLTAEREVTLNLSGFNALEMEIGERGQDNQCSYSAIQTYAATATFVLSSGDGVKTICVRYHGSADVVSDDLLQTIVLDQTALTVSQVLMDGGASYNRSVAGLLSLAVAVNEQLTDSRMRILLSTNGSCNGLSAASDESYTGNKVLTYSGAGVDVEAQLQVCVQVQDAARNWSAVATDTIAYDTQPPAGGSLALVGSHPGLGATHTRLIAASISGLSGALEQQVSQNAQFTDAIWQPLGTTHNLTLSGSDGVLTLYARARDDAGNIGTTFSQLITLDTLAPALTSLQINAGASYTKSQAVTATTVMVGDGSTLKLFDGSTALYSGTYASSVNVSLPAVDGYHTVTGYVLDALGNRSDTGIASIVLDRVAPSGSVLINAGASYTQASAVSLELVAFDGLSGVAASGIKLANNLAEIAATAPVAYVSPKAHTLSSGQGTRTVYYQVIDNAGNKSAVLSDAITVDSAGPSGGALNILATRTNQMVTDATLTVPGDAVLMKVSHGSNSCTGGVWTSPDSLVSIFLDASNITQYASVQFQDAAGNSSVCASDSVVVDTVGPVASAFTATGTGTPTPPSGYSKSNSVRLDWDTAASDCDLAQFSEDIGFLTIDHSSTDCTANFVSSFNFSPAYDGIHTVYARMRDTAGNWGGPAALSVIVDTQLPNAPSGGFSIVQGSYVKSTAITLSHSVVGATKYRAVSAGTCSGIYASLSATTAFSLPGVDGTKQVSVQYSDDASNVTSCYTRSVTLDTVADSLPAAALNLTGQEGSTTQTAKLTLTAAFSGVDADIVEMMMSNSSGFDGASWVPYVASLSWTLQSVDGTKTVYAKLRDRAGNEVSLSDSIALDQTPPDPPALQVFDTTGDGFAYSYSDIELRWSRPAGSTQYELQRMISGLQSGFSTLATLNDPGETYVDTVTQPGTTYYYRIRARDALANYSAWSVMAEANPFVPIDTIGWIVNDGRMRFNFAPNQGTFNLAGIYSSYAADFWQTETPLADNLLAWERTITGTLEPFEEQLQLRTSNQDSSLVYSSVFDLPISNRSHIGGSSSECCTKISVQVDANDEPHVLWTDGANNWTYTYRSYGSWTTRSIPFTANQYQSQFAVDRNGVAHFAYSTGGQIRYANNSGRVIDNENFENASIRSINWTNNVCSTISTAANNEPSATRSLNVSAGSSIESTIQNLQNYAATNTVYYSYYWQRQGTGDTPESGDNLLLEYWNGTAWTALETHTSAQGSTSSFTYEWGSLPATAQKIRFRNSSGELCASGNDDYFVDNFNMYGPYRQNMWVVQTADTNGYEPKLAVDSSGSAHISFYRFSPSSDLRYTTNSNGASWVAATTIAGSNSGHSIAVDSSGKAHVFSTYLTNARHATNASGAWISTDFYSNGRTFQGGDVDIGLGNRMAACFYDTTDYTNYISIYNGTSWSTTSTGLKYYNCAVSGFHKSRAATSTPIARLATSQVAALPYLGMYDSDTGAFKVLDNLTQVSVYDLDSDSLGRSWVAYRQQGETAVRIAQYQRSTGSSTGTSYDSVINTPSGNPWQTDMDMEFNGSTGGVDMVYASAGDSYYAYASASGWQSELIDSGYESPNLSHDWDGTVHACLFEPYGQSIAYSYRLSGVWQPVEFLPEQSDRCDIAAYSGEVFIAVNDTNTYPTEVHIYYGSYGALAYYDTVYTDGGEFRLQTDGDGNMHLVFSESGNLWYCSAYNCWGTMQLVDTDPAGFESIDVQSDPGDFLPHVVYGKKSDSSAWFASRPAGTWVPELLESNGLSGASIRLGFDNYARPHVVYWSSSRLGYASRVAGFWQKGTVVGPDTGQSVAPSLAIAFDNLGYANIGWVNNNTNARYVRRGILSGSTAASSVARTTPF